MWSEEFHTLQLPASDSACPLSNPLVHCGGSLYLKVYILFLSGMSVMVHQVENLDNEKGLSKNVSIYRLDNSMCDCWMVSHVVRSLTLQDKLDVVCVWPYWAILSSTTTAGRQPVIEPCTVYLKPLACTHQSRDVCGNFHHMHTLGISNTSMPTCEITSYIDSLSLKWLYRLTVSPWHSLHCVNIIDLLL